MKRILGAVVCSALLCATAHAVGDQKITLTAQAQPVTRLIQTLDELVPQELKASELLEKEIVCLRVVDVPLEDLMKRIADVTVSKWVDRRGIQTLEPDETRRRQQQEEEWTRAEEAARKEIVKWRDGMFGRYIKPTIIEHLPIRDIVRQKPGTTVVYALSPTKMQKLLDRRVMESFEPEWMKIEVSTGSVTAVDVHVICTISGSVSQITFKSVRSNGEKLRDTYLLLKTDKLPVIEAPSPGPKIEIKPIESALAAVYRQLRGEAMGTLLSSLNVQSLVPAQYRREVTGLLRDPVGRDPLSLFVSPLIVRAAEALDTNFIAALPDNLVQISPMVEGQRKWNANLVMHLLERAGMSIDSDDGWTTAVPIRPTVARTNRIDRQNLLEMIALIETGHGVSPLDCLRWLPDQFTLSGIAGPYLYHFDSQSVGTIIQSSMFSLPTYKLLAALPRSVVTSLGPNDSKIVSPLSRLAQSRAAEMIFNERPLLHSLDEGGEFPLPTLKKNSSLFEVPRNASQWLRADQTEIFPNGLPEARVRVMQTTVPYLYIRNTKREIYTHTSVVNLATVQARSERGPIKGKDPTIYAADEFLAVERVTWTIQVETADGKYARQELTWNRIPDPDAWGPLTDLPKAHRELYESTLARERDHERQSMADISPILIHLS